METSAIWFLSRCRNLLSDENEFDQNVEFIQGYIQQSFTIKSQVMNW